MMMPRPCPSSSRLMKTLCNSHKFFTMEKCPVSDKFQVKVFINLELEGKGRGIFMGVTHLLLLGPFYFIQTNFLYFFAHDCKISNQITAKSRCIVTSLLAPTHPHENDQFSLYKVIKKRINNLQCSVCLIIYSSTHFASIFHKLLISTIYVQSLNSCSNKYYQQSSQQDNCS